MQCFGYLLSLVRATKLCSSVEDNKAEPYHTEQVFIHDETQSLPDYSQNIEHLDQREYIPFNNADSNTHEYQYNRDERGSQKVNKRGLSIFSWWKSGAQVTVKPRINSSSFMVTTSPPAIETTSPLNTETNSYQVPKKKHKRTTKTHSSSIPQTTYPSFIEKNCTSDTKITFPTDTEIICSPGTETTCPPNIDITSPTDFEIICTPDTGTTCPPNVEIICTPDTETTCPPNVETICTPDTETTCPPNVETICTPDTETTCPPNVEKICTPDIETTCPPNVDKICTPDTETTCPPNVETICTPDTETTCPPNVETICTPDTETTCQPNIEIISPTDFEIICTPDTETTCPPNVETICTPDTETTCPPNVEKICTPDIETTCPPNVDKICTPDTVTTCPPNVDKICTPDTETTCPPNIEITCTPDTETTCQPNIEITSPTDFEVICPPDTETTCPPNIKISSLSDTEIISLPNTENKFPPDNKTTVIFGAQTFGQMFTDSFSDITRNGSIGSTPKWPSALDSTIHFPNAIGPTPNNPSIVGFTTNDSVADASTANSPGILGSITNYSVTIGPNKNVPGIFDSTSNDSVASGSAGYSPGISGSITNYLGTIGPNKNTAGISGSTTSNSFASGSAGYSPGISGSITNYLGTMGLNKNTPGISGSTTSNSFASGSAGYSPDISGSITNYLGTIGPNKNALGIFGSTAHDSVGSGSGSITNYPGTIEPNKNTPGIVGFTTNDSVPDASTANSPGILGSITNYPGTIGPNKNTPGIFGSTTNNAVASGSAGYSPSISVSTKNYPGTIGAFKITPGIFGSNTSNSVASGSAGYSPGTSGSTNNYPGTIGPNKNTPDISGSTTSNSFASGSAGYSPGTPGAPKNYPGTIGPNKNTPGIFGSSTNSPSITGSTIHYPSEIGEGTRSTKTLRIGENSGYTVVTDPSDLLSYSVTNIDMYFSSTVDAQAIETPTDDNSDTMSSRANTHSTMGITINSLGTIGVTSHFPSSIGPTTSPPDIVDSTTESSHVSDSECTGDSCVTEELAYVFITVDAAAISTDADPDATNPDIDPDATSGSTSTSSSSSKSTVSTNTPGYLTMCYTVTPDCSPITIGTPVICDSDIVLGPDSSTTSKGGTTKSTGSTADSTGDLSGDAASGDGSSTVDDSSTASGQDSTGTGTNTATSTTLAGSTGSQSGSTRIATPPVIKLFGSGMFLPIYQIPFTPIVPPPKAPTNPSIQQPFNKLTNDRDSILNELPSKNIWNYDNNRNILPKDIVKMYNNIVMERKSTVDITDLKSIKDKVALVSDTKRSTEHMFGTDNKIIQNTIGSNNKVLCNRQARIINKPLLMNIKNSRIQENELLKLMPKQLFGNLSVYTDHQPKRFRVILDPLKSNRENTYRNILNVYSYLNPEKLTAQLSKTEPNSLSEDFSSLRYNTLKNENKSNNFCSEFVKYNDTYLSEKSNTSVNLVDLCKNVTCQGNNYLSPCCSRNLGSGKCEGEDFSYLHPIPGDTTTATTVKGPSASNNFTHPIPNFYNFSTTKGQFSSKQKIYRVVRENDMNDFIKFQLMHGMTHPGGKEMMNALKEASLEVEKVNREFHSNDAPNVLDMNGNGQSANLQIADAHRLSKKEPEGIVSPFSSSKVLDDLRASISHSLLKSNLNLYPFKKNRFRFIRNQDLQDQIDCFRENNMILEKIKKDTEIELKRLCLLETKRREEEMLFDKERENELKELKTIQDLIQREFDSRAQVDSAKREIPDTVQKMIKQNESARKESTYTKLEKNIEKSPRNELDNLFLSRYSSLRTNVSNPLPIDKFPQSEIKNSASNSQDDALLVLNIASDKESRAQERRKRREGYNGSQHKIFMENLIR